MSSSLRSYAALVVTAILGGALAVGAVALLGGLDGDTTTTVVQDTTPSVRTQTAPSAGTTMSVNEIYERAATGVVQINSQTGATSVSGDQEALGSGFVVDKSGHIVTNFHVVEGADEIRVGFSNRDTVEARLVGNDPSTDLAVLRVNVDANALTPLPLGNSDLVKVGDPVVAIGNPFGLDRTATAGIVSAVQRLITAPNQFTIDHVIQTDAPINKGNSGGPLLNDRGEVIGVNTQIETGGISIGNVGIGFAVPAETVKNVVAQILRNGRVEHPHLGITGQPITSQVAESYKLPVEEGILVESVLNGTGADRAGMQPGDTQVVVSGETYVLGGDIIVSADGKKISTVEELRDAIAAHMPGEKLKLQVFRDGEKTSVTVTLGRQPASPQG
ncbi:MAG: trypsin-like peptidase domain-containing protein [Actinobacteria bacterium]|nr:trypsin-like peptidase domain-containing protein [Actinomycetota bacterium]